MLIFKQTVIYFVPNIWQYIFTQLPLSVNWRDCAVYFAPVCSDKLPTCWWWVIKKVKNDPGPRTLILSKSYYFCSLRYFVLHIKENLACSGTYLGSFCGLKLSVCYYDRLLLWNFLLMQISQNFRTFCVRVFVFWKIRACSMYSDMEVFHNIDMYGANYHNFVRIYRMIDSRIKCWHAI
jgi:hypothetical protein